MDDLRRTRIRHPADRASARCRRLSSRAGRLVGVLLLAAIAFPGVAAASIQRFGPVADASVSRADAWSNFGVARELVVGQGSVRRGYLRFDVRALRAPVTRAVLRLYVVRRRRDSPARISVEHVPSAAWNEHAVTFADAPHTAHRIVGRSRPIRGRHGWVTVDVSGLVRRNGPLSLALSSGSKSPMRLASREHGRARAPRLLVTTSAPRLSQLAADVASDPVIAAAGDIACDPANPSFNGGLGTASACRQMATSNLLVGADVTAVLPLGDAQFECGGASAYLRSYDVSWGRSKSISHPAPGNHDYEPSGGTGCDATGSAAGYFGYFGAAAGTPDGGYYSYDLGAWHLIALNSNCVHAGGCAAGSPQEAWLRHDLAGTTASCRLAYWHHPRSTSGWSRPGSADVRPLFQALYDYGADVVLSAHDHDYERFAPQAPTRELDLARGLRSFVVGTGGSNVGGIGDPAAGSEFRNDTSFGVLKMRLHAGTYDWEFMSDAGAVLDAGTDWCDGTAPDAQSPSKPTGLTTTGASGSRIELAWAQAADNVGVISYDIYRDGALRTRTSGPGLSFADTSVSGGSAYTYVIQARDAAGNVSAASNPVVVRAGASPYDAVVDVDAPVSQWKLGDDPAAGVFRDRVAGRNGTQSGGVAALAGGVLNNAGDGASRFDGVDDKLTVPDSSALHLGNTFTLEAWIKRSALGSRTFLFKGEGSWVLYSDPSNRLVLRRSTVGDIVASTVTLTDTTQWHHVVAVKDGASARLYLDGVDVSGPVTPQTLVDGTAPLTIGLSGTASYWSGGIDEVALYSTALNADRVLAHYRAGR